MRGVVLREPAPVETSPLSIEDVEVPEPGPEELLVKVNVCGLCHTDLHTVEGEVTPPAYPVIPGHQVVGVVERVGEKVTGFSAGERVGVGWLNWACGECEFCKRGLENLCPHARFTGLHANGGYAEYMTVHKNFAFRLPENFSDEECAPLLCAGIIGYRTLKLAGVSEGGILGLFGFGASAHLAIQVAVHMGINVYVFTRSKEHKELALRLGAKWAGGHDEEPPSLIDGGAIFAPAGWVVHSALKRLKPGGKIAINAIYMTDIPEMPYSLIYREKVITTVTNYTRQDAREFLKLAGEIPIKVHVEKFSLESANSALLKLKNSQIKGAGVLTVWK